MKKFLKSANHALNGVRETIRKERNFKIQLVFGFIIILLSIFLKIPKIELIIIIFICSFVLILEMINSVIERLVDQLSSKHNKEYGKIKDIMAGAVLFSAILAVIIGILILYKPLLNLIF